MAWREIMRRAVAAGVLGVVLLPTAAQAALAQGTPVGGSGNQYVMRDSLGGGDANLTYSYGAGNDVVLVGDWNGDRIDTLAVRRGNTYHLTNSHSGSSADITYSYGTSSDAVLVGDWDGNGTHTLAVRRGNTYRLTNSHGGGSADITYSYGTSSDAVLVGDWDGNGTHTLAVRRGNTYRLTNSHGGGSADITYSYGTSSDAVLVGDWDGNGTHTLALRRGKVHHVKNTHTGGMADVSYSYGAAGDTVFAGDWNGDRVDTLGVRRHFSRQHTRPLGSLVWADEFGAPAGTPPDPTRWRHHIGGHGWGNNELEYYTDSTANAAHDGRGNLVITARSHYDGLTCHYGPCEYTSARLLTAGRFERQYGWFEARIKVPAGQGLWPAFWMLNSTIGQDPWPNSGEIDVMEHIGQEPSTVLGSLHGPGYSGGESANESVSLPAGQTFAEDFHVFAVSWSPDGLTWYLDGVPYARKAPADVGTSAWVLDDPFFMLLNLAVGGNWPGSPDASTVFPAHMLVDYVRVYSGA